MAEHVRNSDDDEVVKVDGGVWARQFEDLFISLLEEEVKKGNRKTTTLTKQAWSRIREEMRKKGRDLKPGQLKNKFNSLRQRWKDFTSLLNETGMGYSGETGQLTASEETWQRLCRNCIGAIDGTHIAARVVGDNEVRFRGKRVAPTQNIMCVCAFDMTFTYVMVGWEGTANDSRVFMETITKPENCFPLPPPGKFYLVDSGYTNMPGFLTPYRGERYHLRDFRGNIVPQGQEEMFNYLHSSLRNVIERCFGVLKARFPILRDMPNYLFKKQKYIALACCVIHNFIRIEPLAHDTLFAEYENNDLICDESLGVEVPNNPRQQELVSISPADLRRMNNFRDRLAQRIWNRYVSQQEQE